MTEFVGEIEVQTLCPPGAVIWQTSVLCEGRWSLVDTYVCEKDAIEGHGLWVQSLTNDPTQELPDYWLLRY